MNLTPHATLLFIGDSITDAGRARDHEEDKGSGYVSLLNACLRFKYPSHHLTVLNRGISGNRVRDLRSRWQADCLDLSPDILTIYIGINDTWRRYDSNDPIPAVDFEADYRYLLTAIQPGTDVILIEPFVLPTPPDRITWREDLEPKIEVTRRLAAEFNTHLVRLDQLFTVAAQQNGNPAYWAADGVHPTPAGHALIAHHWLTIFKQLMGDQ